MRMTASWSDPQGSTEYKLVARFIAPDGELPSELFVASLQAQITSRKKGNDTA
jgi:hypothetical protein